MRCDDVTERLLDGSGANGGDRAAAEHLSGCARCAALATRVAHLDGVLRVALVAAPPLALQQQLAALAWAAAGPLGAEARPWWSVLTGWVARPQQALAHGVAAISVLLAGWQLLSWVNAAIPVIGDVPYALQLTLASFAAATNLSGIPVDTEGLAAWSVVALAGWSISESGPLNRWGFGSPSRAR